ncbi:MAG: MMPL family transporter [Clostridia bacterium]|nr:MMPL family transporter [Clostridia bacterium]
MKNKVMEKFMLKASGSLNKFSAGIVKGRWICFGVFIALTIACVCLIPQIKVEYDLTTQMPQDSYTSEALDVLKREFDDKGMAYVCVVGIGKEDAQTLANDLAQIKGVANVTYVEQMNFKNNKALYTVNLTDYDSTPGCFETIEAIIDRLDEIHREGYLTGQSAYSYFTKAETEESILKIGVVIVILILVMLIFTSKTYFEILLMLIVFAVAVAINMGTNVLFDGISYIANLVSLVLQLALSLDYMVVLLHRYMEERQSNDAKEATARALSKGIVEICSSALTTIAGLGSLLLMTMPIGVEIGLSLGKSIVASLLSVVFFMPALLVLLDKPLMKSKHRPFVPSIKRPAKAILKARWAIVPLFVVIVVLSCVGQLQNVYGFNYNGGSMILDAKEQIEPEFGTLNSLVVVVPKGNAEKERELAQYITSFTDNVDSVNALSTIEIAEGLYLTDEFSRDDVSGLINSFVGDAGLPLPPDVITSMAQGLFDGYMTEHGITDPNAKVRVVDLLEYLASNDTYSALLGDYATMLDSLIFAKANLESENYSRLTFNVTSGIEGEATFKFIDEILAHIPDYYGEFYITGESIACYDMASNFDEDNMLVCVCSLFFVLIILFFTFKNILLPLVLILAIQGGIWINFVFPFLLGNPVMFIGYLIITAVQMGATIDYAIVLTNRYRTTRHKFLNRFDAMADAQNATFPTVLTSGLILTGTGFALSLLASGTVAAMGSLLGIGTLVSLLVVLFVLPSLLLVTEKAVDKCDFSTILRKLFPKAMEKREVETIVFEENADGTENK